jgi:hypothetical protein
VLESDAGAFRGHRLETGALSKLTANKDRLVSPPENHVELAANQSLRSDLTLTAGSEVPVIAATPSKGGFFTRFFQAYADDWKATDSSASTPAPKFRGYPAPVDGPPFPFSVWPYGGSVVIGQPFTQAGPLMTAIWGGSGGDWWKKNGIQIYGWLNAGANVSTSKGGGYANFPEAYAERRASNWTRKYSTSSGSPTPCRRTTWIGVSASPACMGWITGSRPPTAF